MESVPPHGRPTEAASTPTCSIPPGRPLQETSPMTEPKPSTSRRDFLKTTSTVAATSALAGVAIPSVHAGEDNTIRVALVGCGGRGTGAATNALATEGGPIQLVAMADVFQDKLDHSVDVLRKSSGDKFDVSDDRKFIG